MTDLLTPEQAASRIDVCPKTLRSIRQRGLIRYVALTPRKIRYRAEDVDAYLESCVTTEIYRPTHNRRAGSKRLRHEANVISFIDRRKSRLAAKGG